MAYVPACSVHDLPPGAAFRLVSGETAIALFNVDGRYRAISDACTHGDYSLSEGFVEGDTVACCLHFATFSLETGAVLAPPATQPVRIYPVRVRAGVIEVDVDGGAYHPEAL